VHATATFCLSAILNNFSILELYCIRICDFGYGNLQISLALIDSMWFDSYISSVRMFSPFYRHTNCLESHIQDKKEKERMPIASYHG
jgi:hypothetical protein